MQVHLIDINVSAEIDEYSSLRFQDIRKKTKCHGQTHGRTWKQYTPPQTEFTGGIKIIKETYILKGGLLEQPRSEKWNKQMYMFEKGGLSELRSRSKK